MFLIYKELDLKEKDKKNIMSLLSVLKVSICLCSKKMNRLLIRWLDKMRLSFNLRKKKNSSLMLMILSRLMSFLELRLN
jgi:hypothetical protein